RRPLYCDLGPDIIQRMKRTGRLLRVGRLRIPRSYRFVSAVVLAMHFAATSALAQTPARLPGKMPGWMPWAVAGGIIAVGCVAGFLNPKRSHLG
ncbi:MAG: hypothetical protein JSU63_07825, partial [Phycisphaerales bacterium]